MQNGDTAREIIRLREVIRRQEKALETQGERLRKENFALQVRLEREIEARRWVEREKSTLCSILFYIRDHSPGYVQRYVDERIQGMAQVREMMIEEAIK